MTVLQRRRKSCVFSLHIRRFHQFPKSTWLCNMEFQTKGRTPWMFGLQTFPRIALKFVYKNPQRSAAFTTSFQWYVKMQPWQNLFHAAVESLQIFYCSFTWQNWMAFEYYPSVWDAKESSLVKFSENEVPSARDSYALCKVWPNKGYFPSTFKVITIIDLVHLNHALLY